MGFTAVNVQRAEGMTAIISTHDPNLHAMADTAPDRHRSARTGVRNNETTATAASTMAAAAIHSERW